MFWTNKDESNKESILWKRKLSTTKNTHLFAFTISGLGLFIDFD